MGDLRPDNGSPPDDGGSPQSRGLPDLPPEWGTIVVPDDPAELAAEAEAVRRELRGTARRARVRKALGLGGDQSTALGIPVVIMTVAILTTLVSLLVVTWGNQPPGTIPPGGDQSGNAGVATPDMHTPLTELKLDNSAGQKVVLGDLAPMIVLLVDGCDCNKLIGAVAAAVPPNVEVVPVARTAPHPATDAGNVTRLADPAGTLRARYGPATPDGKAIALVISTGGKHVTAIRDVVGVSDIKQLDPQ